ncbi:DUF192 domain-containing protein [Candidatus Bealeia paramacronuclearis]|uniref:DUF192 domain-containing protein n=1 Tax=Candidatus Bealeia paramacronuclearis TaxID=1921001 RepID=A0ABZ2C5H5_9PROT|nr:hypothetical protein [Candidatus Bealeia paramacronuclearis]
MKKWVVFLSLFFPTSLWGSELKILTEKGHLLFEAELVTTDAQTSLGLMYRTELKDRHGMLLVMNPQNRTVMWMKNTSIPLDMMFINTQGTIVHIQENTKPYSTKPIGYFTNVLAVFEVPSGTCDKEGIHVGDKVSYHLFQ